MPRAAIIDEIRNSENLILVSFFLNKGKKVLLLDPTTVPNLKKHNKLDQAILQTVGLSDRNGINADKDIFFTVGADSEYEGLVYKIDYYFESNSNLTTEQKQLLDQNIPWSLRWNYIDYQKLSSMGWDSLLKATSNFIAENSWMYDKLVSIAWGGEEPKKLFKDTLRKCEPIIVSYTELPKLTPSFGGHDTDFLGSATRNKEIGDAGESLVINYEKNKLRSLGLSDLANNVKKELDGCGYEILSYDETGRKIQIEVKTTNGDQNTPFFFSLNEFLFAEKNIGTYQIYRLYNYDEDLNTADF
jgi:hypothetical protein